MQFLDLTPNDTDVKIILILVSQETGTGKKPMRKSTQLVTTSVTEHSLTTI